MSGFIDRIAARVEGREVVGRPRVHLRRRALFESQPLVRETFPVVEPRVPMLADHPPSRRVDRTHAAGGEETGDRPSGTIASARAASPVVPDMSAPAPDSPIRPDVPDATLPDRLAAPGIQTKPLGRPDMPDVPLPDPLVVVRERVVPVLVDSGVLDTSDEVEVVDATSKGPPDSTHAVLLRVAPAYPWRQSRIDSRDAHLERLAVVPDIHVHIDRIDVVRPAPKPPAPQWRIESVDHAEYLARRRERR